MQCSAVHCRSTFEEVCGISAQVSFDVQCQILFVIQKQIQGSFGSWPQTPDQTTMSRTVMHFSVMQYLVTRIVSFVQLYSVL